MFHAGCQSRGAVEAGGPSGDGDAGGLGVAGGVGDAGESGEAGRAGIQVTCGCCPNFYSVSVKCSIKARNPQSQ